MITKTLQCRAQWLVEHMGNRGRLSFQSHGGVAHARRPDRITANHRPVQVGTALHWTGTRGEAIDAFRRANPAIVICDRYLPDGNWHELWDILARDPNPPMFIVTSKLADDALWPEVLNVGGYDLLLKPFRAEEVIRMVHTAATEPPPARRNSEKAFEILC